MSKRYTDAQEEINKFKEKPNKGVKPLSESPGEPNDISLERPLKELWASVLMGNEDSANELKMRIFTALKDVDDETSLNDFIQLLFSLQVASSITPNVATQQTKEKIVPSIDLVKSGIVIDKGKIYLQLWTKLDASDLISRELTDVENALLYRSFNNK